MPVITTPKPRPTQERESNAQTKVPASSPLSHARQNFARVITISSGKGGVGKSILATNLSIALAKAGKKVCLFDADTNMANINILLGITPLRTLAHFFKENISLEEVLIKGPGDVDIVSGASGVADFIQLSQLQQQKLLHGLRSLEEDYQYLLIDTAAGIDETSISLILAAPYLLLSITEEPTSLTDAFSLLRVLKKYHFHRPILIIVNMVANRQVAQVTFKRFKAAVDKYLQLQSHLAGYILSDKNIPVSILKQRPILLNAPDSPASKCIMQISKRLLNAFDKKQQHKTPFSDYFSDLTFSDFEPNHEFFPAPEVPLSRKRRMLPQNSHSEKKLSETSALLQASHLARLLGEKKRR